MELTGNKAGKNRPKVLTTVLGKTADHCSMCDDGGSIILCSLCNACYCYNVRKRDEDSLEDEEEALIGGACITLPEGFAEDRHRVFRCPVCLSNKPERPVDYRVNQGSRATHRLHVSADLVIVIASLPQLAERGKNIYDSIKSLLGAFEMTVACYETVLPNILNDRDTKEIARAEHPYHLAYLFLTESNAGGGWWHADDAQSSELEWLTGMLCRYSPITEKALSSRIFGLCCGLNLGVPGVVQMIAKALSGLKWNSIILPTASSIVPEEYACIFPQVFFELYYNSKPLKSSFIGVWSKSKRARVHTDLLLIDNAGDPKSRKVQKYSYAPVSSRPWGIGLPLARSFCNCDEDLQVGWKRKGKGKDSSSAVRFGESFAILKSTCGHAQLFVAVFVQGVQTLDYSGTTLVVQDYDPDLEVFPLDQSDRFAMRVATDMTGLKFNRDEQVAGDKSVTKSKGKRVKRQRTLHHTSAWTVEGARAWNRTHPSGDAGPSAVNTF